MKILVVRHAIAVDREDFPIGSDDERPLTPEGIKKMRRMAAFLAQHVPQIKVAATSPLLRARQTTDILGEHYKKWDPLICQELRPEEPAGELLSWLGQKARVDDTEWVLVVGHEPHLSKFIGYCLSGTEHSMVELKKGGACALEFSAGLKPGLATMLWLLRPGLL